jgi:hypothetical protein
MLTQLAADLDRRGVRLVLAGEIGQVRDVLAAVRDDDGMPDYHRRVHDAVDAVEAALHAAQGGTTEVAAGDDTTPGRRHG